MSKTLKTRIAQKADLESNWNLIQGTFIPMEGELIIYSPDNTHDYARVKIGDGTRTLSRLPFVGSEYASEEGGGGTITEIKATGTSLGTEGSINIPAASTSTYGVTKLSTATNSTSTTLAATASAVKSAYDLANTANTAANNASSGITSAISTHNSSTSAHSDIRTLVSTAQTTADAAMPKAGGTFTGAVTAQNNTSYTTKQVRNVSFIAEGSSAPSGSNGDFYLVYIN